MLPFKLGKFPIIWDFVRLFRGIKWKVELILTILVNQRVLVVDKDDVGIARLYILSTLAHGFPPLLTI